MQPTWDNRFLEPPEGASCTSYKRLSSRAGFHTVIAGGIVTSGGRDGYIQQYRLRPAQRWQQAAAEEMASPSPLQQEPLQHGLHGTTGPSQSPQPLPQQQQQEPQHHGPHGSDALDQQLGPGTPDAEADADAGADVAPGSPAPKALWRKLEAAGRQALVPSSLERLPGISTPVADVVVSAADAGSSGSGKLGGFAGGERVVCGWQARVLLALSGYSNISYIYLGYSNSALVHSRRDFQPAWWAHTE